MYQRLFFSLLLICAFLLSCALEPTKPPLPEIKIEGVDPNSVAVVFLHLEGETLPGAPKVVSAEDAISALFDRMGVSAELRSLDDNTWIGIFEPGDSYVIGWIVEDKEMFGYCSEPFVATHGLEVTFSPGMPESLEYDLSDIPDDVQVFPAYVFLSAKTIRNSEESFASFGVQEKIEEPGIIRIGGLASGTYQILAETSDREEYMKTRTRFLYDKREIEVKSGGRNRFKAIYPEVDTTIEEGDITIHGILYNTVGELQFNEEVQLIPYNNNGPLPDLYYPDAVTNFDGRFTFTGVRPDTNVLIQSGRARVTLSADSMKENAIFWLDLMINPMIMSLVTGNAIQEFIIDWKDGQSGKLADFYGKIVVINIWASWSPPSRQAISELNLLASEFSANDDIVFLALCLDPGRETWEETINKFNWKALRHGWFSKEQDTAAFNRPIPYSLILNKKGIILAHGYELDVRGELEKIIEAEDSTGN